GPHRASSDTRLLDGMDCGSRWQPDLPAFTQRRDSRIGLHLAGCGDCRSRVAAQFLKMKLIYTATIALRNCDEIVIDLDLFALLRQVTKQMRDVTTDGTHVCAFQFQFRELVQFVKAQRAVYSKFVCTNLTKLFLFKIEFVLDITDQLL